MAWGAVATIKGPQGDQGPTGATGAQGNTGATGSAGAAGADGKTVRSGSGAPSGGLGADGDFYIRTSDWTIYGPKTGGAWGSPTSIVGPQGATGATGSTGATGAAGADGSAPLTTKGDILGRSSSAAVRVPVGADGRVLMADSGQSSGVTWVDERSATATLTNKRVTKRAGNTASTGTLTFDSDAYDCYTLTALSQACSIANPSGTPTDGQAILGRIRDNGTGRALTWSGSQWLPVGVTLPTTTTANKWLEFIAVWSASDSKWHVLHVGQEN